MSSREIIQYEKWMLNRGEWPGRGSHLHLTQDLQAMMVFKFELKKFIKIRRNTRCDKKFQVFGNKRHPHKRSCERSRIWVKIVFIFRRCHTAAILNSVSIVPEEKEELNWLND